MVSPNPMMMEEQNLVYDVIFQVVVVKKDIFPMSSMGSFANIEKITSLKSV